MDGTIATAQFRPRGFVHAQPVPDNDDWGAELTAELTEKAEHGMGDDVLVWQQTKVKSHLASLGRDGQGGDHRDTLAGACSLIENGCLSDRRPGAAHVRGHEKAALIEKDEARLQPSGVFFTLGHSSRTQPRIAASSRSRARRSGFCGLKPSEQRRRLMWFL